MVPFRLIWGYKVKKIGPLSLDLVVACQIHELEREKIRADFGTLSDRLDGLVSKSAIPSLLKTLEDWGFINSEFGETAAGRAGRLYYIANESRSIISELYAKHWDQVLSFKK